MRRIKREQETDQIWTREERKHKTWGTQVWHYSPLPNGVHHPVGGLWRPQGTRRQDRRPPGRRPFRDQRRSGELASPQVSPHLFLFSLISSPVFLSLGFPRVWCPVLFVKPPSSMCSFNKGLLSVLLVSSLLRVRAPRALWHTRYGLEIFFFLSIFLY